MKNILLICLVLASANAFAGLSKWVDDSGNVHYSDQPPPDRAKAKKLRSTANSVPSPVVSAASAVAASAPAAPKTVAEQEAEYRKAQMARKAAAEKNAKEQSRIETEKTNCAMAQQNLRTLQDGVRLVEVDPQGNRYYVDDSQRRQHLEKAKQDVDTYCK